MRSSLAVLHTDAFFDSSWLMPVLDLLWFASRFTCLETTQPLLRCY